MKYKIGEYEAAHDAPVWRDRANFVFAAVIGQKDEKNEWEQLWGEKVGLNRFVLCCIPFFVKDLALGDEVETDDDFVFQRVIKESGQYTFRVWLGKLNKSIETELMNEINAFHPFIEFSSKRFLALSAPNFAKAQELADYLEARERGKFLKYDTGRSR
jgi:hypothetical protein